MRSAPLSFELGVSDDTGFRASVSQQKPVGEVPCATGCQLSRRLQDDGACLRPAHAKMLFFTHVVKHGTVIVPSGSEGDTPVESVGKAGSLAK